MSKPLLPAVYPLKSVPGFDTESVSILPGGALNTTSIVLGDMNGDGHINIVICNLYKPNQILINNGDRTFTESTLPGGELPTYSIVIGDINGDGHIDIVIGNVYQANRMLFNKGDGSFTDSDLPGGEMCTWSIVLGDNDLDNLKIVKNNCFTNLKIRPYRDVFLHDFIRFERIFLDLKYWQVEVVYLELNFSVGRLSR